MSNYDLIIIGAGPAGYEAGLYASKKGLKTLVIEKDKPGGTCLNTGCIPTKCLINTANYIYSFKKFNRIGITINDYSLNFEKALKHSKVTIKKMNLGITSAFKNNNVDYIKGTAYVENKNEVKVVSENKTEIFNYKNLLIASGSKPSDFKDITFNENNILNNAGALNLQEPPESLAIIGAGAIGVEFAYIFNAFNTKVYLIEAAEDILTSLDTEAVSIVKKKFVSNGIKIFTREKVNVKSIDNDKIILQLNNQTLEVEKILIATGRKPNLGFLKVPVEMEGNFIKVNSNFETSIENVFAVGDIINTPMLAHSATKEGIYAVDYILKQKQFDYNVNNIPFCLYSKPEISEIGLNENKLQSLNIKYHKKMMPYSMLGMTHATLEQEGFVKILLDESKKELLGAVICGLYATEIVSNLSIIKNTNLDYNLLKSVVFPHPTFSEILNYVGNIQ